MIALRLSHPDEGWEVVTPCQVRGIHRTDSNMARVGLEFVNMGNLYSQLEDGLGRYFNRRGADRVQVDKDAMPEIKLRCKGVKLEGRVHDLSVVGMGLWVDHVLAAGLRTDDKLVFTMRLPGGRAQIEGAARIARKVPQGRLDLLGIEFDVRAGTEDPHASRLYEELVRRYLGDRLRWSA